jgi:hypothetical protein
VFCCAPLRVTAGRIAIGFDDESSGLGVADGAAGTVEDKPPEAQACHRVITASAPALSIADMAAEHVALSRLEHTGAHRLAESAQPFEVDPVDLWGPPFVRQGDTQKKSVKAEALRVHQVAPPASKHLGAARTTPAIGRSGNPWSSRLCLLPLRPRLSDSVSSFLKAGRRPSARPSHKSEPQPGPISLGERPMGPDGIPGGTPVE